MYEYKRPAGDLYIVSINDWNKTFAKRGQPFFIKAEVYVQEDRAVVQYVASTTGKVTFVLLAPVILMLFCWDGGVKEGVVEYWKQLNDKRYGKFSSDMVYSNTDGWDKLMKLIGVGDE